jgi:regulatory protein
VAETRSRLRHLGYPDPLIEEVLTRLLGMGYLDDAAFGRAWVESRDRSRPRGEAVLRMELRRKGLDDAVVRDVLAQRAGGVKDGAPDEDIASLRGNEGRSVASADRDAAERLLTRRASALAREPDPRKRRQKAYALLARNGFDPGICQTVSRLVSTSASGPDEAAEPDVLGSGEE